LALLPARSEAAPLDEVSLQQQGEVVLVTINMTSPVHFLRYVPGSRARVVEIYYERVPSSDASQTWLDQEVRKSPETTLTPAFTVTTRDQATNPKLVVEFASEVDFSVSPGGDSHSFVISIKPEKNEVPVAVLPQLPTVLPPVPEKSGVIVAVEGGAEAVPEDNNVQGFELMKVGRDGLASKDYAAAIEAFNKLLMLPPNQYSQDAQEWVGVARERGGQEAKAKVEYELYLKLYKGAKAQAVKQRLAGLAVPVATKSQAATKKFQPRSFVQGGVSSHYYFGQTSLDTTYPWNGATQTTNYSLKDQSSIITTVDATGRYINEEYDNRVVFRDVATQNLLPQTSKLSSSRNKNRVNAAYVEFKDRVVESSARVGRQTAGGGGVMGRFDGVSAGYGAPQDFRINAVAGQLVEFTLGNQAPITQPVFYGVSVDQGPVTVYLINQTLEGVLDRRAAGAEFRYFEGDKTAFALLDYDIYFKMLNSAMVTGTYGIEETGTTFNVMADHRRNPSISTRNALNGALTTSVKDLLATMTETQLRELAILRTGTSTYTQLGLTQKVQTNWQVGGDIKLSKTSGYAESGCDPTITYPVTSLCYSSTTQGYVASIPDSGLEKTLTAQLIGSNLYSDADITTMGASYITSDYVKNGQSMFIYNRTSLDRSLAFDTSWNYYNQVDNYGGSMARNVPMVRVAYQADQKLSFDADLGLEMTSSFGPYQTSKNRRIFSSVGFRWDF